MTISITLTPDQERKLQELAHQSGKDPSNYVSDMLTAHLEKVKPQGQKTIEEILAPVWEGWRQSGMAEDEIDDLFQRELQDLRRGRQERWSSQVAPL
jgi:predicted DNA-binding protein